jgi:hypothetical protein
VQYLIGGVKRWWAAYHSSKLSVDPDGQVNLDHMEDVVWLVPSDRTQIVLELRRIPRTPKHLKFHNCIRLWYSVHRRRHCYDSIESVTWCCVRTSRPFVYSLYLRHAFPLTNCASVQIYRAVGGVSCPFHCCIEHDNELATNNLIISNCLEEYNEPKYLPVNHY